MIDENSQEVITTEGLNNLRSSLESGDYNLKNIITQKGEQTEFHPDSLRAWAERTMKKMGDAEKIVIHSPGGTTPCEILPDGTIHCGNPDPDPGDPTPPSPTNPFDDIDLFYSNEIFLNPANFAEIIFLATSGASQPISLIGVGAMAYANSNQFFGDMHWHENADFIAIGTGLYNHQSYNLLELQSIHEWGEYDNTGEMWNIIHIETNIARR